MHTSRGVEVGNIFKLGTRYSDAMGCTFLDKDGQVKPVIMGSYGIGSGRLLASVAEEHHDDKGLAWPITVAPYQVYLIALRGGADRAEQLYRRLSSAGVEVLYDDRDESPGVKFNDADLIGIPLRLTVSERTLAQQGVEFKHRTQPERVVVPFEVAVEKVKEETSHLEEAVKARVVEMPFDEAQ